MSFILIITIAFHVVATFWAMVVLYKLRYWRMSVFPLMLLLMTYCQFSLLFKNFQGWSLSYVIQEGEIPVFIVSFLAMFFAITFYNIIKGHLDAEERLESSQNFLQSVLDTIPVRVFWKDKDSRYLGCNSLFLKDAGIKLQEDIIGKEDTELPWKERAEFYRSDDSEVMQSDIAK